MSVITENLTNNALKKVSKHFALFEFSSTSPDPYRVSRSFSNTVKYCTELIDKLEEIFIITKADKAFISSGYRTYEHDKLVGGNGFGQHTTGRAVDICFYKNDMPLDNRAISIIAQDLGIKGIARIGYNGYIHLDMRIIGTYYGDETKGYNTVTKDFRDYYRLTNSDVSKLINNQYPTKINKLEYNGLDYSQVFDYLFYYYQYEDLQRAFGKDEKSLFNHFIMYGMSEGRQAHKNFNVLIYKNNYKDLRQAFGNNLPLYYQHYIMYGNKENRIAI